MDGWMYVCKISSTSKGKTLLSIENAMTYFRQTWYVGSGGTSTTHVVCRLRMRMLLNMRIEIPHLHTCSDWLITKKVKYPEFCIGYIDETWYVGSDGHKYYPCGLLSLNVHI